MIDYGLTKLDDHYSWASGWVETQLAEQRLRTSGSVSSAGLERASVVDDEVVAAATDPSASQRLAARQARKLQKKWTKPSGFEWCDATGPLPTILRLRAECFRSLQSGPRLSMQLPRALILSATSAPCGKAGKRWASLVCSN